jgi:hypothetical protein
MLKRDEIQNPNSCLNNALDGERLFVMLARDPAAPAAIRAWVNERLRLGKNAPDDGQIVEALDCARRMEEERGIIAAARQESMRTVKGGAA